MGNLAPEDHNRGAGTWFCWRRPGQSFVFFSPMHDALPCNISGIYFGGGCPERYPEELTANRQLMAAVAAFAEAGGVVYAEYAGLVYLSQSLQPVGNLPYAMGDSQR